MAFGTWAFGPYTVDYTPAGGEKTAVGLLEQHITMNQPAFAQDVMASRYAESVIDGIYRGGNVFVQLILKEWKTGSKNVMWPFDATLGQSGKIGRAMSDIAGSLLLTAIAGTPAANNGPATRTFPLACFSPGHNKEVLFGNVERNVPIIMQCYPAEVTPGDSELQWFSDT